MEGRGRDLCKWHLPFAPGLLNVPRRSHPEAKEAVNTSHRPMPRMPRGRSPVRDGLLFGPGLHGRSMDVSTVDTLTTRKGSARNRIPNNSWRIKKGCGPEKRKDKVPTADPAVSTKAKVRAGPKDQGCKVAKVFPADTSIMLSNRGNNPMGGAVP